MLANLCETTEPEVPNDKQLFSNHLIEVQNMITLVTDIESGEVDFEPSNEREQITEVMRTSNKIWRFRNKIKNGELDTTEHAEMIDEIEDYLAQGQKINAIKYYIEEMKVRFGERVSLRESKDFIDSIDNDLKRRGIVLDHQRKVEGIDLFSGHGQANQSPAMFGHKINGLRCNRFSSHGKVALIFTIFIINENDHTSGFYVFNCFFNGY